jgi:hypothetical protein
MGSLTQGLGANRFLVNGGYKPRISLQHNTWQRWRFLYSGAKVWCLQDTVSDVSVCVVMICGTQHTSVSQHMAALAICLLGNQGDRACRTLNCCGCVPACFVADTPAASYAAW